MRQHPDPDVRQRAMKLFFSRYEDNALVINHLYNALVKDHGIEAGLRGFDQPISTMNNHNDLSDVAIQALNDVTTESYTLVNRYYKLKAKMLGMEKMTLADIYAPLPQSSKAYAFDDAKALVLDGFKSFDNDFHDMARSMFDENRIDAPVEPGKRGGAFCASSTPDLKPYVLLNFTGKVRDVSTMAHELGHAIHAMLSSKQKLMNYHSILPLAETASIFSEMVLTDSLLKKETDVEEKNLCSPVSWKTSLPARTAKICSAVLRWLLTGQSTRSCKAHRRFVISILWNCRRRLATAWISLLNMPGSGHPSPTFSMCPFMYMPIILETCWSLRSTSNI